jgi:hypothetical protein
MSLMSATLTASTLPAMRYMVTIRRGGKVERERYDELDRALDVIEARGRELEREAEARPVGGVVMRRLDPVQRVTARLELSRPRGGIDVRGDGSSEAYTGRLRRRLVEQREGESAYDALRRAARA